MLHGLLRVSGLSVTCVEACTRAVAGAEPGPPPKGAPAPGPPVATWGSSPRPPAAAPPLPRPSAAAALPAAERQGVKRNDACFGGFARGLSDSLLLAACPLHMSQATAELRAYTHQVEESLPPTDLRAACRQRRWAAPPDRCACCTPPGVPTPRTSSGPAHMQGCVSLSVCCSVARCSFCSSGAT